MALIIGNWFDKVGKPFMPDCQLQLGIQYHVTADPEADCEGYYTHTGKHDGKSCFRRGDHAYSIWWEQEGELWFITEEAGFWGDAWWWHAGEIDGTYEPYGTAEGEVVVTQVPGIMGGNRARRRGHITKRMKHPELFPEQEQLGSVSRYWKEHITAYVKAAWANAKGEPTNRAGKLFKRYAQLMYMNVQNTHTLLDMELINSVRELEMIKVQKIALVYYDWPTRCAWFHVRFYRFSDADYMSEIHIHQVRPRYVNKVWLRQFAKGVGTLVLATDKIYPEFADEDYFVHCLWRPTRAGTIQFMGRQIQFWSGGVPIGRINHATFDTDPAIMDLTGLHP